MMNLTQIKTFCEIVRCGNSARAAASLFIEPTAVSMQLSKLEQEIGGKLFDRNYRPMKLTPLGEYFYPRARELVNAADSLEYDIREMAATGGGYLGVGFTRAVMHSLLPDTIREFRAAFPNVKIELYALQSDEQPAALLSGKIQVGISRFRGPYKKTAGLDYTLVRSDRLYAAVCADDPLASRAVLSAEDLNGHPFIEYPKIEPPQGEKIQDLLYASGVKPSNIYFADDIYMALEMVRSNLGYCLDIRPRDPEMQRGIVYLPLEDVDATVDIIAVTKQNDKNPAAEEFLDVLMRR